MIGSTVTRFRCRTAGHNPAMPDIMTNLPDMPDTDAAVGLVERVAHAVADTATDLVHDVAEPAAAFAISRLAKRRLGVLVIALAVLGSAYYYLRGRGSADETTTKATEKSTSQNGSSPGDARPDRDDQREGVSK